MYASSAPLFVMALFFVSVFTAPLNINMGNYSPAMVVGDGAIAFHGDGPGAAAVENVEAASAADFQPVQAAETTPDSGLEGLGRKLVKLPVRYPIFSPVIKINMAKIFP
ncbi:BgTH12-00869 [Blumeria graminis f. sp. triticale]|uniref:BgTH12-00869 n=1 Tax=Blumeria graminis f. sp. triticale TaxID=1689686 RepID=A0A9W4D739_BLUGR|nr:BgTH12-00869 [Blumeria graminis f. sp. triticale]